MINKIVSASRSDEVSVNEYNADHTANRWLTLGCSQRVAHIEAETDDLDGGEISSPLRDGAIEEPGLYDLYNIFTRHVPNSKFRGNSDEE